MSQKTYLKILKYGVYLSLISVFLLFKGLLFPFITSKQLFFNVLIEILLIFWAGLIIKYPEYRPFGQNTKKLNYLSYALLAFGLAITVSSFFGVDFNLSFWGDVERMLGVFPVLHFIAFYFIIITALREWPDWRTFFIIHVAFAIVVGIQSFTKITYATIGNEAYIAGYMIFNIYFCLLLFQRERKNALGWLFLAPIILFVSVIKYVSISGSLVGLGLGIILALLLYGILATNKKVKIATIAGFLLTTSLVLNFFVFNRDNFLTRRSPAFASITQEINFGKRTFQTRLVSWRAAQKDFVNHPVFGTGFGNFAITFDKYFDPKFYLFTRGETYFDRAHNNVIDIASTAGLVGLVTHLLIYAALAYYLIRGYIKRHINLHEFVIISSLITAYFVQNLVVFDSLVTYIASMMTFAFVIWIMRTGEESVLEEVVEKARKIKRKFAKDRGFENKELYALLGAGLIILSIMYQYNIKPWKMLVATIDGQRSYAQGDILKTYQDYQRALAYNTVLDRDSRTSMVRLFANNGAQLSKLGQEKAAEILEFNVQQAQANVDYNPHDSLNQMMLAQMLSVTANFYRSNTDKYSFYADRSIEAITAAVAASPGRIPVYFQKAQIHISRGEQDKAIETLRQAAALSETFEESFCHLGRTLLFYGQEEEGYEYIDQCIDKNGTGQLAPANQIKILINHYADQEDWDRIVALYVQLASLENKAENWTKLAQLYARTGEKEKAIEAAEKAIQLDPSIKQYAEEFINSL